MSVFENAKYKEMKLAEGVYVPDVGMDYPVDDPFARLVPAPKVREVKFDDTYPYIEKGFAFNFQRFLSYCEVFIPLLFANRVRYGMRIEGRGILRKYRKEFKKGIVSVANHCYRLDGAAVSQALRHTLWIPMLSDHFQGPSWWHLKYFGGIPLSDGSFSATRKFNEAFDYHAANGGWIHIFAEARSWLWYKPLRPFQRGAFAMAYKYDFPVLPINISFRERTGIFKLFDKKEVPLITLKIGEPIFPDKTAPRKAEVDRLLEATFSSICSMAGILENPWPPQWHENVQL